MKYIKSFDGLRAVSIIFVLLNHLGISLLLPKSNFFQERVWLLFAGGTGVNIFFVLSGFLITRILLTEMNNSGSISLKQFYIRRALRLLPALFVFYIIIAGLMMTHLVQASGVSFLYSFFYLYNFLPPGLNVAELTHTWSLAVEEQFYFTWPFVLTLFKTKKALYVGLGLVFACMLAKFFLPAIKLIHNGQRIAITDIYQTDIWFIPAVAPIIIGAIGAIVIYNNKEIGESIRGHYRFCLLLAATLFASPLYLASFLSGIIYIIQSLGVALLLAVLLFKQDMRVSRILEIGPLTYIGRISYGIYVYQGLFLRNTPGGKLWIQHFPLNIILTLAFAALSYHFVEKPILRYKEKFR